MTYKEDEDEARPEPAPTSDTFTTNLAEAHVLSSMRRLRTYAELSPTRISRILRTARLVGRGRKGWLASAKFAAVFHAWGSRRLCIVFVEERMILDPGLFPAPRTSRRAGDVFLLRYAPMDPGKFFGYVGAAPSLCHTARLFGYTQYVSSGMVFPSLCHSLSLGTRGCLTYS